MARRRERPRLLDFQMKKLQLWLATVLVLCWCAGVADAACDGPRSGSLLSDVAVNITANATVCTWLFSVSTGQAVLSVNSLQGDPAYTELGAHGPSHHLNVGRSEEKVHLGKGM